MRKLCNDIKVNPGVSSYRDQAFSISHHLFTVAPEISPNREDLQIGRGKEKRKNETICKTGIFLILLEVGKEQLHILEIIISSRHTIISCFLWRKTHRFHPAVPDNRIW